MKGGNPKCTLWDDVVTYCDLTSLFKYTYKYSTAKYQQIVLVSVCEYKFTTQLPYF